MTPWKTCGVALLAIFAFASADARTNPHPSPPTQTAGTLADEDRRGTQASPLVVQLHDGPAAQEAAAEAKEERNKKSGQDWWLIFLTGGLVLVGGVQAALFYWQLGLMRRGLDDAKGAADAARNAALAGDISAKAAQESVELAKANAKRQLRAYIMLDAAPGVTRIILPGAGQPRHGIAIQIKNYGPTPARQCVTAAGALYHRVDTASEDEMIAGLGEPDEAVGDMAPGATFFWRTLLPEAIPSEALQALDSGSHAIYFLAAINYIDAFDDPHTTTFVLRYSGPFEETQHGLRPCPKGSKTT